MQHRHAEDAHTGNSNYHSDGTGQRDQPVAPSAANELVKRRAGLVDLGQTSAYSSGRFSHKPPQSEPHRLTHEGARRGQDAHRRHDSIQTRVDAGQIFLDDRRGALSDPANLRNQHLAYGRPQNLIVHTQTRVSAT